MPVALSIAVLYTRGVNAISATQSSVIGNDRLAVLPDGRP
jgi:hypothetical protein